jgi:hypothetical protein
MFSNPFTRASLLVAGGPPHFTYGIVAELLVTVTAD